MLLARVGDVIEWSERKSTFGTKTDLDIGPPENVRYWHKVGHTTRSDGGPLSGVERTSDTEECPLMNPKGHHEVAANDR